MIQIFKHHSPILTAVLSGIALTLAFAPYSFFPTGILAPAVLLYLLFHMNPRRAFWTGWFFGVGLFSTGIYWIALSIHDYGQMTYLSASLITAIFVMLLALFPAITTYLFNRYFLCSHPISLIGAFPALWVFFEWMRSYLFTGFPWLLLGYSQIHAPLKGYAPMIGVYGVSFITLSCSGLLVLMVHHYKKRAYYALYLDAFGYLMILIIGALLALIPWTNPTNQPLAVSLVQGNSAIVQHWSFEQIVGAIDRYQQLTRPLLNTSFSPPQLIIWPESAIPIPLQEIKPLIEDWDKQAMTQHATLLFGIPIQVNNTPYYYNAIVSLGKNHGVYLKRHLVPFGEYLPFPHVLTRLFTHFDLPITNLLPGKNQQAPLMINGLKILAGICYEVAFPELFTTSDPTISVLLTVTNDAWFGHSSAKAQHLQIAAMRATELQRPLLFASNDGMTAIINAMGQIIHLAPVETSTVLHGMIQPMQGMTPWQRFGMNPILLIILGTLILTRRVMKKSQEPKNNVII